MDARNYAEAVAAFRQAVAADPTDYAAHFNLGFAYTMAGKDAEAAEEFKTVLDLHPGVFEAQLNLGVSLLRLNRLRGGRSSLPRGAYRSSTDSAAAEEGLGAGAGSREQTRRRRTALPQGRRARPVL